MSYKEQYLDPRWQKKRLEVLDRDEWCCQRCYDNESTLHVHHRYYIKKTAIWDYPLEAFLTLCEECHEYETTTRKASEESLLFALRKKFLSAEVDFIAIEIHNMKLLHTSEIVASVYAWAIETPEIQRELIDRFFESLRMGKSRKIDNEKKPSVPILS